jgi:Rod binding domain-containing protein
MTIPSLPQGFAFTPAGAKIDEPAAAREFEALLIARLLKTARQAGEALAGTSKQTGEEGYLEIAEEHIARVMAERGAFGISRILVKGLASTPPSAATAEQAESPRAGVDLAGRNR